MRAPTSWIEVGSASALLRWTIRPSPAGTLITGPGELATAAAEAKKGETIVVLGRPDPVGGKKFNERLAGKRAETVKQELIAAGIPAASIHAGTHKPCCDGDLKGGAELHRELRRTDVEITIKTTR